MSLISPNNTNPYPFFGINQSTDLQTAGLATGINGGYSLEGANAATGVNNFGTLAGFGNTTAAAGSTDPFAGLALYQVPANNTGTVNATASVGGTNAYPSVNNLAQQPVPPTQPTDVNQLLASYGITPAPATPASPEPVEVGGSGGSKKTKKTKKKKKSKKSDKDKDKNKVRTHGQVAADGIKKKKTPGQIHKDQHKNHIKMIKKVF